MALGTIMTVIVCIIILYLVISWWYGSSVYLSGLSDGTKETRIASNKLSSGKGHVTNFAYSIWFYVNDWNYKFGQPKIIFERMGPKGQVSPQVSLDPFENNLAIKLALFNSHGSKEGFEGLASTTPGSDPNTYGPTIHTCNVPNVPLQRWVNLVVSVYGRSLDVYLDGKLVRTCVLENSAFVDPKAGVYLTPDGGFAGWTSNFQYFNDAVNPQQAWNIYKNGYGGSMFGNLFNKYVVRVTFLKDGHEEGSLEI
jgi:hypothetical protein